MIRAFLRRILGEPTTKLVLGSAAANDLVRARMKMRGDDGTEPRRVIHSAKPDQTRNFASQFEVFDFLSTFDLVLSETGFQNGIIFEHDTDVASESFDTFTSRMYDELDAMGWIYEGWEAAFVSNGE